MDYDTVDAWRFAANAQISRFILRHSPIGTVGTAGNAWRVPGERARPPSRPENFA